MSSKSEKYWGLKYLLFYILLSCSYLYNINLLIKKVKLHVVFSNVLYKYLFFSICHDVNMFGKHSSKLSLLLILMIIKWNKGVKVFATVNKWYFPSPFLSFWKVAWGLKDIKPWMLNNFSKLVSKAYLIHSISGNYRIAFGLNGFIFFYGQSWSLIYLYPS